MPSNSGRRPERRPRLTRHYPVVHCICTPPQTTTADARHHCINSEEVRGAQRGAATRAARPPPRITRRATRPSDTSRLMLVGGERRPPISAAAFWRSRCYTPERAAAERHGSSAHSRRRAPSTRRPSRAARPPASPPSSAQTYLRRTRRLVQRVCALARGMALSCRYPLWRRWCNAPGQWARRAAGAPLATRGARCSGAVVAAGRKRSERPAAVIMYSVHAAAGERSAGE